MTTLLLGEGVGPGQQANLQILDIRKSLSKQRWMAGSQRTMPQAQSLRHCGNLVTRHFEYSCVKQKVKIHVVRTAAVRLPRNPNGPDGIRHRIALLDG